MMDQGILDFPKQFEFEPKIANLEKFQPKQKFVLCGMGGSHHASDILQAARPDVALIHRRDYALPDPLPKDADERLFIASSYSGTTEEPVDFFQEAYKKQLSVVAIGLGRKLIDLAKEYQVPYIQLPDTGIEPRMGIGLSFRAMAKFMGFEELLESSNSLAQTLQPAVLQEPGQALAKKFFGSIPVIYTSSRNWTISYNWKIKFNETGKIPAFNNVFPELNHNEIEGFGMTATTKGLSEKFHFIFIKDSEDHPRNQKRMSVTAGIYKDQGWPVTELALEGQSRLQRIFSSLLLADWCAFYTAKSYDLSPEGQPIVDEFKKLIN